VQQCCGNTNTTISSICWSAYETGTAPGMYTRTSGDVSPTGWSNTEIFKAYLASESPTTFGGVCSGERTFSSMLYIQWGLSFKLYFVKMVSSSLKYESTTSYEVDLAFQLLFLYTGTPWNPVIWSTATFVTRTGDSTCQPYKENVSSWIWVYTHRGSTK
jgi:hypothetical protein